MNHTYRTIWSESQGTWVAVSELDAAQGKPTKNKLTCNGGANDIRVAIKLLAISTILLGVSQSSYANSFIICTGQGGAIGDINYLAWSKSVFLC